MKIDTLYILVVAVSMMVTAGISNAETESTSILDRIYQYTNSRVWSRFRGLGHSGYRTYSRP